MTKSTKRAATKHTPHAEGFLESAAQAIGSTLGSIALKTGLAKSEPQPKTMPARNRTKKPAARPQRATSAVRKTVRKRAQKVSGKKAVR
jgi:hypothetical protein